MFVRSNQPCFLILQNRDSKKIKMTQCYSLILSFESTSQPPVFLFALGHAGDLLTHAPQPCGGRVIHARRTHRHHVSVEKQLPAVLARVQRQLGAGGHNDRAIGALGGSLLHSAQNGRTDGIAGLHECIHVAGDVCAHSTGVHRVGRHTRSTCRQSNKISAIRRNENIRKAILHHPFIPL